MSIVKLGVVALSLLFVSCGVAKSTSQNVSLGSTEWKMAELNGERVISAEDSYILNFGDESSLSAKGECNMINGRYSWAKDGSISIETLASTRMMCPNIDREALFVEVLDGATSYRVDNGILQLFTGDDLVATFIRK